jgi:hypothetical protein
MSPPADRLSDVVTAQSDELNIQYGRVTNLFFLPTFRHRTTGLII